MVISESPCFTSAPSRKWTASIAPATRDRSSTRSTASRRPENSSQIIAARGSARATDTGVAGAGFGAAVSACVSTLGRLTSRGVEAAAATSRIRTPSRRPRREGYLTISSAGFFEFQESTPAAPQGRLTRWRSDMGEGKITVGPAVQALPARAGLAHQDLPCLEIYLSVQI